MLPLWPVSKDATVWIANAAPSASWATWVFRTNHFGVGYRPVTALSYTLDYLAGGFAALPYRLTDLGLHLSCVVLIFFLYRRMAPTLPRWGGVVAAGLFAAHPIVDQVVPQLARRSYSLATALGLSAMLVLYRAGDREDRPRAGMLRSLIGGILLAAAVLSHEAVCLLLPVVVWNAFRSSQNRADRWRRGLAACVLPVVLTVGALALRTGVIGGVGGYSGASSRVARVVPIAGATWTALIASTPFDEGPAAGRAHPVVIAGSLLLGLYYLWRGAAARNGVVGLLLVWVLVFAVVFSLLGVWFPRQVYLVAPPFVLLVSVLLVTTIRECRSGGRLGWAHLLPQGLLILSILAQSPLLFGSDPSRAAAWSRTDTLLRGLHETLSGTDAPTTGLGLVLPHFERPGARALRAHPRGGRPPIAARQAELWMKTLLRNQGPTIQTLLIFRQDPLQRGATADLRDIDGRPWIWLGPEVVYHRIHEAIETRPLDGGTAFGLDSFSSVYFHDGERGRLIARGAGSPP